MDNSLHEICVEAVNKMVQEGIELHVSFVTDEDSITFDMRAGLIPKVTIEWVSEDEAK